MILESKDYFNINPNKRYNIILVKTKQDIIKMIEHFEYFKLYDSKKKYIGMDFEFNSSPNGKQIALFQINLEYEINNANIYLFYPPDLNSNQLKVLKNLLIENSIKKILHGGESLDIPYLFKNIFTTRNERNNFCRNLFDTRYMCEYLHLDNKIKEKCKIYKILLELNVINNKQYNMLLKNEEDMGPIYEIQIDVRKLDKHTMLYSAFDVLYLPTLLKQFPDTEIYMELIPQLTCFNFIDRYEEFFSKPFSELLNKANNYFLKINSSNLKMIDIFNYYYYTREGILLNLMEINYYKKFIETFIKFIVYKNISNQFTVYMKNNIIADTSDNLKELEKEFTKIHLPKQFENFFTNIRKKIKTEIINM